jgi:hypothetical protein
MAGSHTCARLPAVNLVGLENAMNRAVNSLTFLGFCFAAAQVPADDSLNAAIMTKRQMISECIQRQKSADVTLSKVDIFRICKAQLKQEKANGSFPEPPAQDSPRN